MTQVLVGRRDSTAARRWSRARAPSRRRPRRPPTGRRTTTTRSRRAGARWPWLLGVLGARSSPARSAATCSTTKIQDQLNANKPVAVPDVGAAPARPREAEDRGRPGSSPRSQNEPSEQVPKGQVSDQDPGRRLEGRQGIDGDADGLDGHAEGAGAERRRPGRDGRGRRRSRDSGSSRRSHVSTPSEPAGHRHGPAARRRRPSCSRARPCASTSRAARSRSRCRTSTASRTRTRKSALEGQGFVVSAHRRPTSDQAEGRRGRAGPAAGHERLAGLDGHALGLEGPGDDPGPGRDGRRRSRRREQLLEDAGFKSSVVITDRHRPEPGRHRPRAGPGAGRRREGRASVVDRSTSGQLPTALARRRRHHDARPPPPTPTPRDAAGSP